MAFAGLFGAFLGLSLLKFGNPPIMEKWVSPPADPYEFLLFTPWPIAWAYRLLGLVALAGMWLVRRRRGAPWWLVTLPALWLLWQFVAGGRSVDPELTRATLKHFAACVLCFYLGFFCLDRLERLRALWPGLICAFMLVLVVGWEQHFGGLEESRRYFFTYVYPHLKEVPPGYIQKISSHRIFSTLFYPNALAGAILLLLPATLMVVWRLRTWLTPAARGFLMAVISIATLACLFWSGSKGGWLLMLGLGLVALLRMPLGRTFKTAMLTGVLLAGLAGFFWKYSGFFQKGATSVTARFDYWRAAFQTARESPFFGTGPGTFAIPYEKIKQPASEMTRLVHNDYLEQASDSGLIGLLTYGLFIAGALVWGYPTPKPLGQGSEETDWFAFSVWLGVLGWSLQSLLEFSLYVPALAWPAFTFLGLLLANRGRNQSVNVNVA